MSENPEETDNYVKPNADHTAPTVTKKPDTVTLVNQDMESSKTPPTADQNSQSNAKPPLMTDPANPTLVTCVTSDTTTTPTTTTANQTTKFQKYS